MHVRKEGRRGNVTAAMRTQLCMQSQTRHSHAAHEKTQQDFISAHERCATEPSSSVSFFQRSWHPVCDRQISDCRRTKERPQQQQPAGSIVPAKTVGEAQAIRSRRERERSIASSPRKKVLPVSRVQLPLGQTERPTQQARWRARERRAAIATASAARRRRRRRRSSLRIYFPRRRRRGPRRTNWGSQARFLAAIFPLAIHENMKEDPSWRGRSVGRSVAGRHDRGTSREESDLLILLALARKQRWNRGGRENVQNRINCRYVINFYSVLLECRSDGLGHSVATKARRAAKIFLRLPLLCATKVHSARSVESRFGGRARGARIDRRGALRRRRRRRRRRRPTQSCMAVALEKRRSLSSTDISCVCSCSDCWKCLVSRSRRVATNGESQLFLGAQI